MGGVSRSERSKIKSVEETELFKIDGNWQATPSQDLMMVLEGDKKRILGGSKK
jgi:hypothetical protein